MGNGCTSYKAGKLVDSTTQLPKLKFVIVGESSSGKSSIVERFEKNQFHEKYQPSNSVNIVSVVKKVNIPNHGVVSVELWDVPDHVQHSLRKSYYINADAIIVIVDISDEDAYDHAIRWKCDALMHLQHTRIVDSSAVNEDGFKQQQTNRLEHFKPKVGSVPMLLLGNKFDIAKQTFLQQQYSLCGSIISQKHEILHNIDTMESEESTNLLARNAANSLDDDSKQLERNVNVQESVSHTKPENSNQLNDVNITDAAAETNDEVPAVETIDDIKRDTDTHQTENQASNLTTEDNGSNKSLETNVNANGLLDHAMKSNQLDLPVIHHNDHSETLNENHHMPQQRGDNILCSTEKRFKKLFPKDLMNEDQLQEVENVEKQAQNMDPNLQEDVTSIATPPYVLPSCIEELESCAEENGFIAGIAVSAKDSKGGIHEAIQSLVRHIISKRSDFSADRKRKTEDVSVKYPRYRRKRTRKLQNPTSIHEFTALKEVGIIEIDAILKNCNSALRQSETLITDFRESIHMFKMACHQRRLGSSRQASIEECVAAIDEAIQSTMWYNSEGTNIGYRSSAAETKPELKLTAREKEDFLDLVVARNNSHDYDDEITAESNAIPASSDISFVLELYHEKVHQSCSNVMRSSMQLEDVLVRLCKDLSAKEENAWDIAVAAGLSQDAVRAIMTCLAQGKVRVKGTTDQIKDTRLAVKATQARIRAALLF